ncbi:MAG: 4-hydroxythreonine-4-phosphate dehydrogenase PdxA, partial [Cytophagales bacterium]
IVYGSSKIFNKYRKLLNIEEATQNLFFYIKSADSQNPKRVNLINCWEDDFAIQPGVPTEESGKASWLSLKMATEDLKKGWIDAVVTCPINKKNMQSDEFNFPGHTEFFAHHFGNGKDALMFMIADQLRIAVATGHVPLAKVSGLLSKELIFEKLMTMNNSLKRDFNLTKPRIAVLGLNPHAGEEGLLGNEEQEVIIPAIEQFKEKGNYVFGPFPADGFFGANMQKSYDAVLAMYHDQGLVPFKTIEFENGVNFSAGLSVVRTSPDHGTAYSLAGKNKASVNPLREAVYLAVKVLANRKDFVTYKN